MFDDMIVMDRQGAEDQRVQRWHEWLRTNGGMEAAVGYADGPAILRGDVNVIYRTGLTLTLYIDGDLLAAEARARGASCL